jgi:large subunit ribosomal protein L21
MHAVIKTGGKQYKVSEGDVVDVERLDGAPGDEVDLEALLLFDGGELTRGGGTVRARVVDEHKAKKLTVFKYKSKTGYRKKRGHRQIQTRVEILSISPS